MNKIKNGFVLGIIGIGASVFAVNCGTDSSNDLSGSAFQNLGNFNVSCDGQSGGQQTQKQIQMQQQQQSCTQQMKFVQSKVTDMDVNLDCNSRRVVVKNKGPDPKSTSMPIQNGKVKGSINVQQQIQSDNKGNQQCWVESVVTLDGDAQCDTPSKKLSLNTQVGFQSTSSQKVEQEAGVANVASPAATISPNPSPSISGSPSPSPTVSGSPSPSPSPSPSVSPSPRPSHSVSPTPTPTVTSVVVCKVEDPCTFSGKADLSCPGESNPSPTPSSSPTSSNTGTGY